MNRYVDVLNRIRQNANLNWLTPAQQGAYQLVREQLKFLDEVNLWGYHGVGKTFLGWILWKQGLAVYAPRLQNVKLVPLIRTIVVDNLGWRRAEVREVLYCCRGMGYNKVLLITTDPVQDQITTVQLTLRAEDIKQAAANLRGIGIVPYSDTPHNLWELVSPLKDLNG